MRPRPRSSPGCQRATADLEVRTACKAPSTVWVGADVIKVLAGPELAQLTYRPPSKDEMGPNPLSVAEERGQQSPNDFGSTAEVEPPPKDEAVRAHEYLAAIMLQQGQPVATLAELEAALCLAEQQSLVPPTEIRRRWQTLAASAISWSLDCLTAAGEQEWIFDQALQMLCTAEILTRTDVAETFGAKAVPNRLFLRALSLSGLGGYYQQRGKPRAAVRFLEQAVAGHAKFAHPAVLLNLCSAHLQLREPGPALSYLSQAVLALRSAAGRLCPQQAAEVDASATAATAAVLAVLGPAANPEDMCSEVDVRVRKNLWVEMDPLGRGIDLGEQQRLRVEPGGSLETPEASVSSLASQSKEVGRTVRYSGPRRGLGRHGLISKEHAASSKDAFQYEVDAAVVKTLLVAKVLLWPWPELGEEVQQSQEIVSAYRNGEGHVGLEAALKSIATPGIAKHAAKLKKVWPEWGKIASEAPVPGAGLVLRECLLLTFVHAATALAQLSSKRLYDIWVVPPLREGLVLAIVLFGSKHPLALRLIHACQRAQVPQQPPAPPPDPSRLARPRPRVDPTEPKLRPKPPKTASVKVRARPKRPQTQGHVPAWNAGAGLQPEKEEKLHPAGQVPDAVLALAGGAEYMQAQSARRHGSSRPSVSPVRKDFWAGSQGQRAQEHLERQAKSEIRRELQRPLSSDPLTSRRRRPEATAQGLAPSSTPATPRSQTPETERGGTPREPVWKQAARDHSQRAVNSAIVQLHRSRSSRPAGEVTSNDVQKRPATKDVTRQTPRPTFSRMKTWAAS